jgi:hypothetical protein
VRTISEGIFVAQPRALDVEPGRAFGRQRVTLVAAAALAALAAVIVAIVIAGNSSDDGTGARVSSITDVIHRREMNRDVTVGGTVQSVREGGRIFAINSPNTGGPDARNQGAVLVVSKQGVGGLTNGVHVTVTGTVRDVDSRQVSEAAGQPLRIRSVFPEFRAQPVIVAEKITSR